MLPRASSENYGGDATGGVPMRRGWVRLHRSLLDHPLWNNGRFTKGQAWVDLVLMAAFEDREIFAGNRHLWLKRGQVFTAQTALAARWRWDRETVRAFLRRLQFSNMIVVETSKATDTGYTLITLLNYEHFQSSGGAEISEESSIDSAIDSSIEPASNPHPPATPKKEKKEKKRTAVAAGLTLAEYRELLDPEHRGVLDRTVEAIATTRQGGKVAPTVLDGMARRLSRYRNDIVLRACQIYLDRDCAGDGKDERYLFGIVRGEMRRPQTPSALGRATSSQSTLTTHYKTEGQTAIDRALRAPLNAGIHDIPQRKP